MTLSLRKLIIPIRLCTIIRIGICGLQKEKHLFATGRTHIGNRPMLNRNNPERQNSRFCGLSADYLRINWLENRACFSVYNI